MKEIKLNNYPPSWFQSLKSLTFLVQLELYPLGYPFGNLKLYQESVQNFLVQTNKLHKETTLLPNYSKHK